MAYNHTQVSGLFTNPHENTEGEFADTRLIDGKIRVIAPLADFASQLKQVYAYKDCQFAVGGSNSIYKMLYVFHPGQMYTMGRIGYVDSKSRMGKAKEYIVQSRKVANNKFRHDSLGYYEMRSTSLAPILRKAKSVLTPYTAEEILEVTRGELAKNFELSRGGMVREVANRLHALREGVQFTNSFLFKELVHMVNSGYQFADTSIRDKVLSVVEAEAPVNATRVQKVYFAAAFMNGVEAAGSPLITVVPHKGSGVVKSDVTRYNTDGLLDSSRAKSYSQANLPVDIAGRMAVLSMVEDNTYVHDVGMRVNDRMYYLASDDPWELP